MLNRHDWFFLLLLWKKLVDFKQLDMKYLRLYTLDRYKRRLMYVGNNV